MAQESKGLLAKMNPKVKIAVAIVFVLIIAFVLIFVVSWGISEKKQEELLASGTFLPGISIDGITVSGLTFAQAEEQIVAHAKEQLTNISIEFAVGEDKYTMTGSQLGAQINYHDAMKEAMFFGRNKSILVNNKNKKIAAEQGANFELKLTLDEGVLDSSLEELSVQFDKTVKNATIALDVGVSNEDKLTISGAMHYEDEVTGRDVDREKLRDDIVETVLSGDRTKTIETVYTEAKPEITKEDLMKDCDLIGSYTTTYTDSSAERCFNIWKMAEVVHGLTLAPGQEWSINNAAGPRTTATGWKDAPGIVNGALVNEPGGGICQTSSTLYVALLKAEVEIVDRTHHSWPLGYVELGQDATISTGSPDFVFKNNYDAPIYILAECEGKKAKTITFNIYGPSKDYTVELESEQISSTEPTEAPVVVVDGSMAVGTSKWTKPRKNRIEVKVWKIKKDKGTGEVVGEKELLYTDVYKAMRGEQTVGPAAPVPDPAADPAATQPAA